MIVAQHVAYLRQVVTLARQMDIIRLITWILPWWRVSMTIRKPVTLSCARTRVVLRAKPLLWRCS